MRLTNGILWYFFIIYVTSVIVNFSNYHEIINDTNESIIQRAVNCLLLNDRNNQNNQNCKFPFELKRDTALYLLKNLINRKELTKSYKLTTGNGSKKGTIDMISITLDLKPLFSKDSTNTERLNYWYTTSFILIILITSFITPLWSLTNFIYLITMISMFILSLIVYLILVKHIVFILIYLITLKKYNLWLLPNLTKDVSLLRTFWPLYELNKIDSIKEANNNLNKIDNSQDKINDDNLKSTIEFKSINLPTITRTPPINDQSSNLEYVNNSIFNKSKLEVIDLNSNENSSNEQEEIKEENDDKLNKLENKINLDKKDDFANITPVISYLNVNDLRKKNFKLQRSSSNRSDDDFEIVNNDFLNNSTKDKSLSSLFNSIR